jgi:M6 family metalloprotease-like protein
MKFRIAPILTLVVLAATVPQEPLAAQFVISGDVNDSGSLDISDAVYLLDYLFQGGPAPKPVDCPHDPNEGGGLDIGDVIFVLEHLFRGGPTPPVLNCPGDSVTTSEDPPVQLGAYANSKLGGGTNTWIRTGTRSWTTIHGMSTAFVARDPSTNVAIIFSADAYVEELGRRMYVRVLVDGEVARPGRVIFATGPELGSHSYVFRDSVDEGNHVVEIQWAVEEGRTGVLRNGTVEIWQGPTNGDNGSLIVHGQDANGDDTVQPDRWQDVAGTAGAAYVDEDGLLVAAFSAESYTVRGFPMYVRLLVDGRTVSPDVFLTSFNYRQSRTVLFHASNLAPGRHDVRVQARGTADRGFIGSRNLLVASARKQNFQAWEVDGGQFRDLEVLSSQWTVMPGMDRNIRIPPNGEVTVRVSADIRNLSDGPIYVRALVGDRVASPGVRTMASDDMVAVFGQTYASFVLKGLNLTGEERQERVRIEWRSTQRATTNLGSRSMIVSAERNELPDVTGRSRFGEGHPEFGTRRVLVILAQTRRDGNLLPPRADIGDWLFGEHSVAGLWEEISGGKIQLEQAGLVGPYELPRGIATYGDIPCDSENSRGFVTGGREIWMTMLLAAAQSGDVDFSTFDDNRDGVVTDKELAILFVMPETTGGATRRLENCPDSPLGRRITLNGVELTGWAAQWGAEEDDIGTAAHELGHVLFGLKDMYVSALSVPTEPGAATLMADSAGTTSHLDAVQKIDLGWATPIVLSEGGRYSLEDIAYGREAFVLPRLDGLGSEYIVIENRQEKPVGHPKYDEGIRDSGIAVWHVIDPQGENSSELIDSPPRCAENLWDSDDLPRNPARRAIRLVRPGVSTFGNLHHFFDSEWGDLEDRSAAPLPCPRNSREGGVPLLQWADGTPSGYSLRNFSRSGRLMSFDLVINDR